MTQIKIETTHKTIFTDPTITSSTFNKYIYNNGLQIHTFTK